MFDRFIYQGLHFIMKYAGQLNAWAWRRHVKIIRSKQEKENEENANTVRDLYNKCEKKARRELAPYRQKALFLLNK